MLTGSTDSNGVLCEFNHVPAIPQARQAFFISSPPANILCPNRLKDTRDFSSFFNDSGVFPCETGSKQSLNPSFGGSPFANSPLGGENHGHGVGTNGGCSIVRSMEMLQIISDKQPANGNYGIWDHNPLVFPGWLDQGDRRVRQGGNIGMVNYGSKQYDYRGPCDWSCYAPMCVRDPQLQLGYLRPPLMLHHAPATVPGFLPRPPLQSICGPMPNPGFSPQMYILPTNPCPDYSRGNPFVYPPAPLPAPPSMPFSLEGHKRVLIMKQIEFYFSSENLRTDFYLKMHMDNCGWVSIHLIAGFRRIKQLTDNIPFILDSLIPSVVVEVKRNRVRKRFGWNDWVRKPLRSKNDSNSENQS